jgi:hypothetical protein
MKTAMQELIEYLDPIHSSIKDKAIQLLEMEKEQMKEHYTLGVKSGWEAHECKTKD